MLQFGTFLQKTKTANVLNGTENDGSLCGQVHKQTCKQGMDYCSLFAKCNGTQQGHREASDIRRPGLCLRLGPETRKRKMENQETTTHFVNLPVGPGCHHWSLKKDMFTASLTWWSDQACELQAGWQTEDWTESMAIQVWHK